MRAYSELYVAEAQRKLGAMLDYAVNGVGADLSESYHAFIACGLADKFGAGAPWVVAGRSGAELAIAALDLPEERIVDFTPINGASAQYWTGWALAYYQWSSACSFATLEEIVPIDEIERMYHPYHEMDITSFCHRMDEMVLERCPDTNLKTRRLNAGLSQSDLAAASGVPLRTLQQYEQRRKDINKAQAEYIVAFARVLCCDAGDLLEHTSGVRFEYGYTTL